MKSENFERCTMEYILNHELHTLLILTRDRLCLTQSAMARRYFMAKNTYSDLEGERHGFGLLTAYLLLQDQDDPKKTLDELSQKLDKALEEVIVLI